MTTPYPGQAEPNPRTWAAGDIITSPRLRDTANLAGLFVGGRPLLIGQDLAAPTISGGTLMQFTINFLNNWNVAMTPVIGSPSNEFYPVPFAGFYLIYGNLGYNSLGGTPTQARFGSGIEYTINSSTSTADGGTLPAPSTGQPPDVVCCELLMMGPATGDEFAMYGFTNSSGGAVVGVANMTAEWVAMPAAGLAGYTGPTGTVVASPQAAAPWPSGPGTTLNGSVAVGATGITVFDNTGMITGGTLGLDYINAQLTGSAAEAVTITSVAGTSIGISATNYAHANGAPVAVPISAAFLNQQARDIVNFLAYPPICKMIALSTNTIATTGFPPSVGSNPGNQIVNFTTFYDNFSGSSSSSYTAPVGGVYFVYGQIFYNGATATTAYSAGLSVNGGTITWGNIFQSATSSGALAMCATITRHLRVTAGQTITLWAYQGSGSTMNTVASGTERCKLIIVWRGF